MKDWYDDYLDNGQATIAASLDKDDYNLEDLQGLLNYEESHDNRMKVIDKLKDLIKKKSVKTDVKKSIKTEEKMAEKYEKTFVLWNESNTSNGRSLPEKAGSYVLRKNRPVEVSQEAAEYIEKTYPKEAVTFFNEKEYEKWAKEREAQIAENQERNK